MIPPSEIKERLITIETCFCSSTATMDEKAVLGELIDCFMDRLLEDQIECQQEDTNNPQLELD